MTKEITKAVILQELQDKLKLREFLPQKFLFDETVIPVYDIERHIESRISDLKTLSVGSTGAKTFYTVPYNERWHLRGYNVVFMTGVYSVAGLYISRTISPTASVYLDLAPAQTVSYCINLVQLAILDPGDTININVDGYTSTGDLRLYIDYVKEEIR